MRTTHWMVTLLMTGALCASPAMAAATAEANKQPVARLGQGSAAVQGESDACPVHNKKDALGKGGEQCSCPHDNMHHHHMSKHDAMHGGKPETCDPAKEAAKPFKPVS